MIYINGHRASRADLARLWEDILNGKNAIKERHETPKGATAITTEF